MAAEPRTMRFGVFLGPYHRYGINPNLAMRRDIELAAHLDALGFDEIWFGEHHSGGVETIASPEVMIAAAAQHTTHIKLGTGVLSLPYHQPFILADRVLQLDHLTRGRMMFGAGPGQLLEDATMIGIEPSTQRARMEEALEVMLRLFDGETVTAKTEWFTLQDAVLQLARYSDFEVAVTGSVSSSGPALAGRYGASLLSLAATDPTGIERLAGHWDIVEHESAQHGHTPDRSDWRLLGPMYIAETVEQAKKDVAYGMPWLLDYLAHITPTALGSFDTVDELCDALNASGRGVVGTPDMAVEQLTRLQEKSGGFGTYLFQGSDYARWPNMLRSYQLFAEEVVPRMNGQLEPVKRSVDRVLATGTLGADTTARSQAEATARYEAGREKHA
ncbi:monooxygenase (plasmid) [Pseudonocardia sp. EC080610-09]|uniref:LLM class flavin-dependent oxidoreductase n=1 Tax=unclassified Pseudonocardia TaxID=2619320 RepID=UPI000706808E|nr:MULTISPECIES: LLM class flavin-dependent oxidoreductase [unclassified Pseudonocardia]ALL79268.1 monooxygenase [Pseudonocardia sp. EC080610-09]ALL85238.1 monooxygenase [Pseudonocardia sp. EC080619-01]